MVISNHINSLILVTEVVITATGQVVYREADKRKISDIMILDEEGMYRKKCTQDNTRASALFEKQLEILNY